MIHIGSYISSSEYTIAIRVNIIRIECFFVNVLVIKIECVCTLQNSLSKSYSEESGGFQ